MIEGGTKQGGDLLVYNGFGFRVNKKYTNKDGSIKRFWICCERECDAKVNDRADVYISKGTHNHPEPHNLAPRMKLIKEVSISNPKTFYGKKVSYSVQDCFKTKTILLCLFSVDIFLMFQLALTIPFGQVCI